MLVACAACGGDPSPAPSSPAPPADAALTCRPGTMPNAGRVDCTPVGPSMDAKGFTAALTGWGYDAVRPDHVCTGAMMALLGERDCQPVDDCSAAFPPPDADIVLSPASTPSPTLLTDAIAKVAPGGTIALDAGDYEAVSVRKNVRLIGRCAEKVTIRMTGAEEKGLDVASGVSIEVRSLGVSGFKFGVFANGAAHIVLDRVVLAGNRGGVAASNGATVEMSHSVVEGPSDPSVTDPIGVAGFYGAKVHLSEVDVRGEDTSLSANSAKTEFVVDRSIAAFEHVPVYRGAVLEAWTGVAATVTESVLSTTHGRVLIAGRTFGSTPASEKNAPAATVRFEKSLLLQSGAPRDTESAMDLYDGAHVTFDTTTIRHQSYTAVGVSGAGSLATFTSSLIASDPAVSPNRSAVIVLGGARAELAGTAVVDAQQVALRCDERGSSLSLTGSLVLGTRHRFAGDLTALGGTGQAVAIGTEAILDVDGSSIVSSEGIGVFGLNGAILRLGQSLVDDTRAIPDGTLGTGLFVSSAQLRIDASAVRRSRDAALVFDGASGIVATTALTDNQMAVRTSGGTDIVESNVAPVDIVDKQAVLYESFVLRNATSFSQAPIVMK